VLLGEGLAGRRLPNLLAGMHVVSQDELLPTLLALNVEAVAGDAGWKPSPKSCAFQSRRGPPLATPPAGRSPRIFHRVSPGHCANRPPRNCAKQKQNQAEHLDMSKGYRIAHTFRNVA